MLRGFLSFLLLANASAQQPSLTEFRASYEAKLKAPNGYLSVAGLWWLKEGVQRAGSDSLAEIVLPTRAPAIYGAFQLKEGKVTFTGDRKSVV